MEPVILFRKSYDNQKEFDIVSRYFKVLTNRTACKNQLVIGRYSCLPYYRELEQDLKYNNCCLANTHDQHCWIADFAYYHDLIDFTARSWTQNNFYLAPEGKYVVKGATNSRKHQWRTHMFAENKKQAIEIACELRQDGLLCDQEIIYRQFIPLNVLGIGEINGIPFANEWRFFYYKRTLLSYGYYWSSAGEEVIEKSSMTRQGLDFAETVANVAADSADFFVLDIAEKKDGKWILIEVNDAQSSGLSENNADVFYRNLSEALNF